MLNNIEENESNINAVNVRIKRLKSPFSRGIKEFRGQRFDEWNKVVRSFPHLHKCSGFFIAKLEGEN